MSLGRLLTTLSILLLILLTQAGKAATRSVPKEVPAPQGIVLTGGKIQLDFGDGQSGLLSTDLNRLDQLVWSGGTGALAGQNLIDEVIDNNGSTEPEDIFGESFGVYGEPQAVGPGYAAVASNQTTTTLTTTTTGTRYGAADNEPIASTDYQVFPAGDPNENEFRVSRTINFGSATPNYPTSAIRVYMPDLQITYGIVLYPNAAGSIVSLDYPSCSNGCKVTDWNGRWFAEDDDSGTGMVVFRDVGSQAPAELVVAYEEESADDLTSIAVLQPANGFQAPLTETEWVCFYDPSTWTPADQQAGNLPKGCAQMDQAVKPAAAAALFSGHVGGGGAMGWQWLGTLAILASIARGSMMRQRGSVASRSLAIMLMLMLGTVGLSVAPVRAQQAAEAPQPYVGVRAGQTSYQYSAADLEHALGGSSEIDTATISKHQFGGMLYGGVPIYRSLTLEVSYAQLGQFPLSIKATSSNTAALAHRILGQLAPAGHGLTAGFALPLQFGPIVGLESRLSALYYQSKQVVAISSGDYRNDLRGVGIDAGLSLTFRVAGPLQLGVGADCMHMTQACNVLLYSGQIEYHFGRGGR